MLHLELTFPQGLKSAPEDVITNKVIAQMRSNILGDPYDRSTLEPFIAT
jgi:hypothetical protein